MSGRRHGNISRSAPLDLCLPFPPSTTPGYDSISFAAVTRIFARGGISFIYQMRHNFVGVFVSLFYPAVFRFPRGQVMFFFSRATTLSSGRRVSRTFCLGMKSPEREADHPLPISRNIKSAWIYTRTAPHIFMAWNLIMHMDKLNLYFP